MDRYWYWEVSAISLLLFFSLLSLSLFVFFFFCLYGLCDLHLFFGFFQTLHVSSLFGETLVFFADIHNGLLLFNTISSNYFKSFPKTSPI